MALGRARVRRGVRPNYVHSGSVSESLPVGCLARVESFGAASSSGAAAVVMWITISIQFLYVGLGIKSDPPYGHGDGGRGVHSRAAQGEEVHGDAVIWMVSRLEKFS